MDVDRGLSPPPRPAPSGRMSLSALVNSPPPASPPRSSRVPDLPRKSSSSRYEYPPAHSAYDDRDHRAYSSSSRARPPTDYYGGAHQSVGTSYHHRSDVKAAPPTYERRRPSFERDRSYESQRVAAPVDRYADEYDERPYAGRGGGSGGVPSHPGPSSYAYRSPSPARPPTFQPYEPSGWKRNGRASPAPPSSPGSDRRSVEPQHPVAETPPAAPTGGSKKNLVMRPDDSLVSNEEVWQEKLRAFQMRREVEAFDMLRWTPAMLQNGDSEQVKVPVKRKGWPADHPTRIAQRQAKEAALAAGIEIPKKKYVRRNKKSAASAAIDDELLGLVEGDAHPSSPMGASSAAEDDGGEPPEVNRDATSIVWPSGLTRAEVMAKVEADDLRGLTEDDVKQVQDEMWLKKNGPAALRKDGTMRKKPGPAKGWKAMRKAQNRDDEGSEAGDRSVAAEEADADIAALLEEPASTPQPVKKATKRKKKSAKDSLAVDASEIDELKGADDEDDALSLLENGDTPVSVAKKPRTSKAREPGVGKGRWTRPSKEEKELKSKAGAIAMQQAIQQANDGMDTDGGEHVVEFGGPALLVQMEQHTPNTYDPRGVSEAEAHVRLGLVEDLQKQAWAQIIRDAPKVYRVMQASESTAKMDAMRTAQACVRNAFSQRSTKPTFRTNNRTNKDAAAKAKKVMREMLVYWKKNEKEELAARKRAEKEAMEKAKAEEEARESKRQARKLNFLLTQTELYSHFIGKKIKTHEAENMDGGDVTPAPVAPKGADELENVDSAEVLPDIDYDDDDEENLRRHAAKGAQAAIQAARDKARQFDSARPGAQNGEAELDDDTMDGDELNFQNPSMGEDQVTITQPKMLMAQLKEYQLKGLTWLGNLYEQGINGILADEMGLGKTIQSISLLAYLAEVHNLWGPFLVIAPASTLHNWQQELARFVPRLKALPYWGSPKDRETLRRIWNRKNQTFNEDSPFHILVTSYQLAVQDEKYFQMMRWQYMILDEAQAIKSSSSARWKSLLSLNCRNRLLLTGTPIQNSMHELWALLHFIMPSLFDSHEEFSEWFSKDIENAAGGGNSTLKPEQLKRLHMILKPFMLRRVKKHVQKELGDKIEIDVLVDLSQRQRSIYKALRQRVSIEDLLAQVNNADDKMSAKNLMNLVMQFRKVCNHPDLFERADVVSPFLFGSFSHSGNLNRQGDMLYCPDSARNPIEVQLPRIMWTEGGMLNLPSENSLAGSDTHVLQNLLNIWSTEWINSSIKQDQSAFGFLKIVDWSPAEANRRAKAHPLVKLLDGSEDALEVVTKGPFITDSDLAASTSRKFSPPAPRVPHAAATGSDLAPLRDITSRTWNQSYLSRPGARFAVDNVVAPAIKPVSSSRLSVNVGERLRNDDIVRSALYGVTPSDLDEPQAVAALDALVPGVAPRGLLGSSDENQAPLSSLRIPPTKRLIVDSAKLARLDDLLRELKDGGHRVLLYFQMTKMMDLIEEYLIYRQYKYLRLDGSSPIGERRDMVTSWQTNPDIFVFCLSTRAGGLGINLTAADTVIFYDHDWNPSNDAQAMDRAHRVGQTKQVTVYRLIARGTIEERIVKLARAKKDVQDIVVGTKSLNEVAKPAEIASLFMDDEELAESMAKRKAAEAHGYVAPAFGGPKKSAFGDGLGNMDDEDDGFFSAAQKAQQNNDDDENGPSGAGTPVSKKRPAPKKKDSATKPRPKKKVKLAADGLPI
ncbi:putative DNA helicase ino80 [Vanrija albida]|uniref:Chromatin-remodeling ATPase INO80 n=1 Tax=Vanrija albida TaxID=181172 RepID=A0ABR3Q4Y0_9TREE